MTLENIYGNETKLRNAFSWLTRIGAGPAFGSRPIGWYQMHQCAALDIIKAEIQKHNLPTTVCNDIGKISVRCKLGHVQARVKSGWVTLFSSIELFQRADNQCRK
jgi:hypothetical protein